VAGFDAAGREAQLKGFQTGRRARAAAAGGAAAAVVPAVLMQAGRVLTAVGEFSLSRSGRWRG
jgi:hypothetical protein